MIQLQPLTIGPMTSVDRAAKQTSGVVLTGYRSGAILSPCLSYRPALWRIWNDELPTATFIGLNPSTADAARNDPTIRRCIDFSQRWRCGSLLMLNLFDYRATRPSVLFASQTPCSSLNDAVLELVGHSDTLLVAAWGNHGAHQDRANVVQEALKQLDAPLNCLGVTRLGQPVHPLYKRKVTRLRPYRSV